MRLRAVALETREQDHMAIGPVGPFKIESESEADEYLKDLLSHPEYRSMSEVCSRARALIKDQQLRDYFVSAAKPFWNGRTSAKYRVL